jgi:hypothetical protein
MLAAELLSLLSFSASPFSLNEPPPPPLVSAFASAFAPAITKAPRRPAPPLTRRNPREIYGSSNLGAEKNEEISRRCIRNLEDCGGRLELGDFQGEAITGVASC